MRYSPFLSCRQAATLITAELDRELDPLERLALSLHLRICDACPKVVRQFALLRQSMRLWREEIESAVDGDVEPDRVGAE